MKVELAGGRGTHIMVIDDMMTEHFLSTIKRTCISALGSKGRIGQVIGGKVHQSIKNCLEVEIENEDPLSAQLCNLTGGALSVYRQEFPWLYTQDHLEDTGFLYQRYGAFYGFYREHCDSLPDHATSRILAMIFYIDSPESGGETHFPYHDVTVEPKDGRILIFPALWTHPHAGLLPLGTDKAIITTFIQVPKLRGSYPFPPPAPGANNE